MARSHCFPSSENALSRAVRLALLATVLATPAAHAADADSAAHPEATLPEVKVKAAQAEQARGVSPGTITSTTKGETRPLETPQSITVLTRELLDSRQDKSLVEALQGVAGVVAGERGRRGFDDFGIRGQEFGQEKFVDGLNTVRSGYIPSEEVFGAERIEILKGPASLLFGNVRPGGLVNVVSKRPKREAFGQVGVTVGSYDLREGTFDFGRPLSESGKAAFRINGVVNRSDDEVDFIYFKNRYVAPSLSLDFGPNTDFTLLAAYQEREWQRNQGIAPKGTVLPNRNGKLDRDLFIGEPSFGNNDAQRERIGYELTHRFDSGWTLQQNFRWEHYDMTQRPSAFYGTLAADERTQSRTGNIQHDNFRAFALDTYVSRTLATALGVHDITIGVDLNDKHGRLDSQTCTSADLGTIDLFNPVYGVPTTCTGARTDTTQDIEAAGLYARDRVHFGERLHVTFGARHDRVTTRTFNEIRNVVSSEPKDSATTGMVGLVYEVVPGIAPYASYATSFVPISGVDRLGGAFDPEKGRQAEVGVKFERDGGRQTATVAVYDLRRENVLTPDPVNTSFSVQDGEHHSKGVELETAADFRNGWSLTGAYAYTDAEVSKSNTASQVGRPVNNVPKHNASIWAMYRLSAGALAGWRFGLGARYESEKRGYSYDFTIPGHTTFDAAIGYEFRGVNVALNVRNLTDKNYYGGALSNSVVTLGDPRVVRLNVTYDF